MVDKKFNEIRQFANHLLHHRAVREPQWRELSTWLAPHRGIFDGEDLAPTGKRRNENHFTAAAMDALGRACSGITSGMTPRNISWFEPDFADAEMIEASGARTYLDAVDQKIKAALEIGSFYQSIFAFNTDLLWAGCALLYTETSAATVIRFECVQVGTFAVELDADKRLDAVYRTMVWTPARLAKQFGRDKLSKATQSKLDTSPYESIRVHHLVRRRNIRNPQKKDAKNLPFESFFWEEGGEDLLHEGGYHEMPYFFTVWNEGACIYGTGPGDDALPDARQFDQIEIKKLRGLAALVNPPMQAPKHLKGNIKLHPGEINYVDQSSTIASILDLTPYAHAMKSLQEEEEKITQRLENILKASIFTSIPYEHRPNGMTATEYITRKRETLQQLGPVISAYEPNVLTPLLHRVVGILDREGLMPVPPQSLMQYPIMLRMDFISPMATALRQTGAESTRMLLDAVLGLAQVSPEVMDKLDLDQAVDEMAWGFGAPGAIVRADSDVQAMREQRQQAQMAEQNAMMMNMGADVANKYANVMKTANEMNLAQQQAQMQEQQQAQSVQE